MNMLKKSSLFLILSILCLNQAEAQRGRRNMDPEQLAERQTAMMKDSLVLSEAQVEKIAAVNLLYANKMDEERKKMRNNNEGDREAMRSEMRTLMQNLRMEQKAELKKYLTAEQFEKWEKIEAAQRDRRRSRGEGRKGRRNRGENKDDN